MLKTARTLAMHEFALTEQMLAAALQICAAHQPASRPPLVVASLHLRVGNLTGIVAESMRFCLQALAAGTPAAGATLEIVEEAAVATCSQCGVSGAVSLPLQPCCARCGGVLTVAGGHTLVLERVVLREDALDQSAAAQTLPVAPAGAGKIP
jgi:hydrogenase nickel incorporation protein HypA/HybF